MSVKIFVDSDVVISSLLSSTGAAYLLLSDKNSKLRFLERREGSLVNSSPNLKIFVSYLSKEELEKVIQKLEINKSGLDILLEKKLKSIELGKTPTQLKEDFQHYVFDPNDAHIVAGAVVIKAQFLVSYNIKHLKTEKIKQDFGIIVTTPANLLQYLRSQ